MHTQIQPHCACKCAICPCSLPCRRLLTPSMGLSYPVLFGNTSCFHGNRWAGRDVEMGGQWEVLHGFDRHGAWILAHLGATLLSLNHQDAPTRNYFFAAKSLCGPTEDRYEASPVLVWMFWGGGVPCVTSSHGTGCSPKQSSAPGLWW